MLHLCYNIIDMQQSLVILVVKNAPAKLTQRPRDRLETSNKPRDTQDALDTMYTSDTRDKLRRVLNFA